jgi:hypothetical protein
MKPDNFERPPEVEAAEPPVGERESLPLKIRVEPRPPLPMRVRIGIFIAGWILILIGVVGLVVPGLQGILTILAGAALLSIDNELVYRKLRQLLARWPATWHRFERFRERVHDRLHDIFHRK